MRMPVRDCFIPRVIHRFIRLSCLLTAGVFLCAARFAVTPEVVSASAAAAAAPRFTKVLELAPEEGVFAYARISPDGQHLAYASEISAFRMVQRTVRVVNLESKRVLFTEPGIDAYWSNDGRRMIFLSHSNGGVTIRHQEDGRLTRDVAPEDLGDYFSWAVRDGRDFILTIQSRYYFLNGDRAELPAGRVTPCPDIGVGERPLISKDGRRITTFVRGIVLIRSLTDCNDILDTGIRGAKADFSFDGRYVAFHAPKPGGRGYEIQVVDVVRRTVRTVTDFPGSSFFPSWTEDGRLCFRYDGDDYRGFMIASDVLSAPERALPSGQAKVSAAARWADLFPAAPPPVRAISVVLVWAPWSAHSPDALADLQRARTSFAARGANVGVSTAVDTASQRADVVRTLTRYQIDLPEVALAPEQFEKSDAVNQMPTTLLFRGNELVDRRLGAQTAAQLEEWVGRFETAPQ
jgi:hypothetical protein